MWNRTWAEVFFVHSDILETIISLLQNMDYDTIVTKVSDWGTARALERNCPIEVKLVYTLARDKEGNRPGLPDKLPLLWVEFVPSILEKKKKEKAIIREIDNA